jgi:hypothetical protein
VNGNSNGKALPAIQEVPMAPTGGIPTSAATNPQTRDYSIEKAVFSFIDYEEKECELHSLDKNAIKALTKKLKTLSAGMVISDLMRSYFKDKIENGGKYASLYRGLKDVELYEIVFGDKGRIFAHVVMNEVRVVAFGKIRHK